MRSFVGWSLICPLHPPALNLELERERTKEEKEREVLHLFRCYTHTHTSNTQYHQASHPIHHAHTHTCHSLTHIIRGRMYTPVSLWRSLVSAALPPCPSGVPWSPPLCRLLLRGRRETWCTAKGSDVRPGVPPVSLRCPSGVPPVSLGLRRSAGDFCVAGVGLGALQRGRMYAPVSPLVSAALPVAFAWQAWGLVHCKGVGCTPRCPSGVPPVSLRYPSGVPWSPPPCRCMLMGIAKGSGVRPGVPPVSLRCPSSVPPVSLRCPSGVPPVSLRCPSGLPVACAWQACLYGVPWSPPLWLLRGRRGAWCTAKEGSDVRPRVPPVSLWRSLVSAALPVAFAWQGPWR